MESWGDSIVAAHGETARLAEVLGITAPPVRIDSMAKYGALARGDTDMYLRFPPPTYREKVWDHAAGAVVVTEAGGIITVGACNLPRHRRRAASIQTHFQETRVKGPFFSCLNLK